MPRFSQKKLLKIALSGLFVLLVVFLDPNGDIFGSFEKNYEKSTYFEKCVKNNTDQSATSTTFFDVVEVSDGDTITINDDCEPVSVRLIGIDTPETVDPRKPVQCFGKEASAYTKEKLMGKKIMLETDSGEGEKDKYGRTLGYVILEDGTNFNRELIAAGYAHEYTYDGAYKYQKEFKEAEKEARENGRGLWAASTCNGVTK